MPRVSSPLRNAGDGRATAGVSELRKRHARETALGVCRFGEVGVRRVARPGRMRYLRRPARPRKLPGELMARIALQSAIVLVAAAVAVQGAQQQAPSADAAALAGRLQKRYETIRDFTAEFSQTYQGRVVRRTQVERGKVQVKKPYRIRFTYETPERKEFVSDGTFFYSYFQADRVGSRQALPKEDEASMALLFLAGRGNLARDFTASIDPKAQPGEQNLRLVPRKAQADFQSLTLIVEPVTLALKGFITTDEQGASTVRFSNLKENTGLTDKAFSFSFPPGTEIIK